MKKRPKGTTSNYNDNKVEYQYIVPLKIQCVGGIMVSIAAFQAVDPGSIPGRRNFYGNYFDNFQGKKIVHAVTRIRTWVTAATTQGPNH